MATCPTTTFDSNLLHGKKKAPQILTELSRSAPEINLPIDWKLAFDFFKHIHSLHRLQRIVVDVAFDDDKMDFPIVPANCIQFSALTEIIDRIAR